MKKRLSLILVFLMLLVFGCGFSSTAFATTQDHTYSNVLEDLQQDSTFDISQYPSNTSDNSLTILTLAESVNNELFVYVYSPAGHDATSINISVEKDNLRFFNYPLELLDKSGVFAKYKVLNLSVGSDEERYYEISSIYRSFIDGLDTPPSGGGTITEVSCAVGTAYTFTGFGDDVNVTSNYVEVITITDKYVGLLRYNDPGYWFKDGETDVHFVAFSTNKRIDKLLEADVYYVSQSVMYKTNATMDKEFGPKVEHYVHLDSDVDLQYTGNGWTSKTQSWQSIQSSEDFLTTEAQSRMYESGLFDITAQTNIKQSSIENIQSKDWVLRFAATEYTAKDNGSYNNPYTTYNLTLVAKVTTIKKKVPKNLHF